MQQRMLSGFARRRFAGEESGTASIEAAIVLPVFLMMLFGIAGIGQAYYAVSSAQWAVEQTAREMMIDGDVSETEIENQITALLDSIGGVGVDVIFTEDTTGPIPIARLQTTIVYPVSVPLLPTINLSYNVDTVVPRPAG